MDDELRSMLARWKQGLREKVLAGIKTEYGDHRPMHYVLGLEALRDFVDDDLICMGDIGEHNQWSRFLVETRNRTTFLPEGFWGAMAAKLAFPEKNVVSVTGDGCFLMASADFSTAVENGINPVIIILNDEQYGMIVGMQQRNFGRISETALNGPDFVAFAKSFGGDGMRVDEPGQMAEALERGLASDVIFVIDARCDFGFPAYDFERAAEQLREEQTG